MNIGKGGWGRKFSYSCMKKFIVFNVLLISLIVPTYCQDTVNTEQNASVGQQAGVQETQQVKENNSVTDNSVGTNNDSLTKDSSTRPDYALDYNQFGLETPNYDEQKIIGKLNKKATQVVEGGMSGVQYLALLSGLVALGFILFGFISRGFRYSLIGFVALGIDLVVYSVVSRWPLLYEAFSHYFWQ